MLDQQTLKICKAAGGQLAAMARNYEAAKSATHKAYIENFIRQNMPSTAWIAQYQSGKESRS